MINIAKILRRQNASEYGYGKICGVIRHYCLDHKNGLTYKAQSGDKHGLESSSIPDARRWINAVAIFGKIIICQTKSSNSKNGADRTMTPEPKYLAKLCEYEVNIKYHNHEDLRTNSNTSLGTCSHLDRFARTGNKAPAIEPTSIMNTEAILRPKDESSPPPEPQSTASDIVRKK